MRRSVISRAAAAVTVFLAALGLAFIAAPAHAAPEDVITNLDVHFDVRESGLVRVTYQLDYQFGETGRRGIVFDIIRLEPYGDGVHDARYDITNIAVDSPSGAPDQFEQSIETTGSTEAVSLRIGDPDQQLSTREASYVISYDMAGGLETHEAYAELYRDVTTDYPHIEQFRVEITAPGGVSEVACAAGASECTATVDQGTARMTGRDLAPGDQLTIAAKLDPARIADAQPQLEVQPVESPRTLTIDSTTTLRPDGAVEVRQATRYRLPEEGGEVTYAIPTRRAFSDTEDQVFEVSQVAMTDESGAQLATEERTKGESRSTQALLVTATIEPAGVSPDGYATLTLTYVVRDAFRADPDDSQQVLFRWPLVLEESPRFTEITAAYATPGPLAGLGCTIGGTREECDLPPPERDERTGTFRLPRDLETERDPQTERITVVVPADSVGNQQPLEGESLVRRESRRMGASFLTTLGLVGAFIIGGFVSSRGQAFPNLRYAGVPPGVLNSGGAVATDEKLEIPVRFEPPETDLATAGRLLDGDYRDRHTTAEIVDAAVRGVVRIQMKPFTLWQGRNPELPPEWSTWFDPQVKRVARAPGAELPKAGTFTSGHRATSPAELTSLVNAVRSHQPTPETPRTLLRSPEEIEQLRRARWKRAWLAFGVITALLIGLRFALVPVLGGWANGVMIVGIIAAGFATSVWRRRVGRTPLSADGTALTDQVIGFRTYLSTAEAHQLRFEMGEDIYSRYLPWAVLFDIADKWTATCQELVARGAMPPLRTPWIDERPDRISRITHQVDQELSRSVARTRAAAAAKSRRGSSSGTGGRSAFSGGGIRSGGGGGGSSSRSW